MRTIKAFLAAPILPIILFGLFIFVPTILDGFHNSGFQTFRNQVITYAVIAPVIAYLLSFILALPAFLALRAAEQISFVTSAFAGALIASVLVFGPELMRITSISGATLSSQSDGCQSVIENTRTVCGYLQLFQQAGIIASIGAATGGIFWLVYSNVISLKFSQIICVLLIIWIAVFVFSSITKDRTCHNMFRDGRRSISPVVRFSIPVDNSEFNAFKKYVEEFSMNRKLSFRDYELDGRYHHQYFGICSEAGVNIVISKDFDRRRKNPDGLIIRFHTYETKEQSGYKGIVKSVLAAMPPPWKSSVEFTGEVGEEIARPIWAEEG